MHLLGHQDPQSTEEQSRITFGKVDFLMNFHDFRIFSWFRPWPVLDRLSLPGYPSDWRRLGGRVGSWEPRGDVSGPVRIPKVFRNNVESLLGKFIFWWIFEIFAVFHDFATGPATTPMSSWWPRRWLRWSLNVFNPSKSMDNLFKHVQNIEKWMQDEKTHR